MVGSEGQGRKFILRLRLDAQESPRNQYLNINLPQERFPRNCDSPPQIFLSSTSDEVASLNEGVSPKKHRMDSDKMLDVLLESQTRELFGLQFNDVLTVAKVEWVRLCNPSTSYFYQIISLIRCERRKTVSST
jgi:hypothetical protein